MGTSFKSIHYTSNVYLFINYVNLVAGSLWAPQASDTYALARLGLFVLGLALMLVGGVRVLRWSARHHRFGAFLYQLLSHIAPFALKGILLLLALLAFAIGTCDWGSWSPIAR